MWPHAPYWYVGLGCTSLFLATFCSVLFQYFDLVKVRFCQVSAPIELKPLRFNLQSPDVVVEGCLCDFNLLSSILYFYPDCILFTHVKNLPLIEYFRTLYHN